MDTISPVYARFVVRELERKDIATDPLFAVSALSREELLGGGDIRMEDFLHILTAGHELIGDEHLGLMIGSHAHIIALGEVGAAMAVAPSIREGVQALESFTRLHTSYISTEAVSNLDGLVLQVLIHEDLGSTARFHIESAAMMVQNYVETLTGLPMEDAIFSLGIPRPDYVADYAEFFHGRIRFEAETTGVFIPRHWLDLPSPYYNAQMWQQSQLVLSTRLKVLADTEERPYVRHLQSLLNSSETPLPDLAAVAASLHISDRTLNRRLQREGSSFRDIKSSVLIDRAKQYLSHTSSSVEAIAAELGYQDAANFRRAFRKYMACTPNEYRARGQSVA